MGGEYDGHYAVAERTGSITLEVWPTNGSQASMQSAEPAPTSPSETMHRQDDRWLTKTERPTRRAEFARENGSPTLIRCDE